MELHWIHEEGLEMTALEASDITEEVIGEEEQVKTQE